MFLSPLASPSWFVELLNCNSFYNNAHNAQWTKFNQIQQIERKMWELNAFSELRTTKAILNSFPKKSKA